MTPSPERKTERKRLSQFLIYPAKKGEKYIRAAVEAKSMGFGGELKVLVGFDAEGKIYRLLLYWRMLKTPGKRTKVWSRSCKERKGNTKKVQIYFGHELGETPLAVTKG